MPSHTLPPVVFGLLHPLAPAVCVTTAGRLERTTTKKKTTMATSVLHAGLMFYFSRQLVAQHNCEVTLERYGVRPVVKKVAVLKVGI